MSTPIVPVRLAANKWHDIILLGIGLFVIVLGAFIFVYPPALSVDPSQAFQVWHSMQFGSGFNNLVAPQQADMAKDGTSFLTWWSPGQYYVPYLLKSITGLNMGRAVSLTVILGSFCGLAGFYFFFRKIGFNAIVAAVSLLFVVVQLAFAFSYVYYTGGEILIFAFEGWFLYGCLSLKQTGILLVLFVLLSALVGFFLKSSFLWVYGAGLACIWVRLSSKKKLISEWAKSALWIGIPAAISFTAIYLSFISKGESPVTQGQGLKLTFETFGFPLASPILSAFSVDDLCNGLINRVDTPIFSLGWSIMILALSVVASVVLVWCTVRYVPNNDYRLFLTAFYVTATLFFGISYLRQLDISMDARHFRVVGILIVPGVVYLVYNAKLRYKILFAVAFIGITIGSVLYLVHGFRNIYWSARGITGLAQLNIDQASLNEVLKIDSTKKHVIFVFIGDDIGLELSNNRFISLQPIPEDLKVDLSDYEYDGFAGPIYIILPQWYQGARQKLVISSFPGYKSFQLSMLSPRYMLYLSDTRSTGSTPTK